LSIGFNHSNTTLEVLALKARSFGIASSLVLLMTACGEPPPPETPPPPPPPPATAAPPPTTEAPAAPPEPPKPPPVEIKAKEAPAKPEKMPSIKFSAPKANESIKADKAANYEVKWEVKDWPLEKGGAHMHLIIDNQPYKAIYDAKGSIKLGEIAEGAKLDEGQHILVAFPSRKTHISVKPQDGKSPLVVIPFWIGKAGKDGWKTTDPTLVYSRPKGTYEGDMAKDVLLDFYLINAELGEGKYAVQATVTPPVGEAKQMKIASWGPYSLLNLPAGDNKVKLELLDKDGKLVPGAWNSTERTITIKGDAK